MAVYYLGMQNHGGWLALRAYYLRFPCEPLYILFASLLSDHPSKCELTLEACSRTTRCFSVLEYDSRPISLLSVIMQVHIQPHPNRMDPHPSAWGQQRKHLPNAFTHDWRAFACERPVDDSVPTVILMTKVTHGKPPFCDMPEQGFSTMPRLAPLKQLPSRDMRTRLP